MRDASYLEVNLGLLQENFSHLKKFTKSNVLFMVKANAYGHGLVPVTEYCLKKNLCRDFGCASLGEALILKKKLNQYKFTTYVFSETNLHEPVSRAYYGREILPVIHRMEDLEIILEKSEVPLVLKFNTGMNRLGLKIEDLEGILKLLKKKKRKSLFHVMSHYSLSYLPMAKQKKTQRQYKEFNEILKKLRDAGLEIEHTSIANSGAIEQKFSVSESFVRPGLMMYGPSSLYPHYSPWEGKVISKLSTQILHMEKIKKGETIGYGDHVVDKDGLRLVLPLGYGDGLFTFFSGTTFKLKNFDAKFLGRVNMDLSQLYLPTSAEKKIKVNEQISIWDHENTGLQELALQMKTIPYQLLCAINERIPRRYQE